MAGMFLIPLCILIDIIAGGQPVTPAKIQEAKQIIESAGQRAVSLAAGEFEVVRPADGITRPLLIISTDETVCQTIEVAANQPFACWMRKRGEADARLHVFPPAQAAWVLVVGAGPGQASLMIVASGENQGPPVLLERIAINVGPRPPPGPTPGPSPDPQPQPLPGQGLRVVIVYESSEKLPPEQSVILTSRIIRDRVASYNGKIRVLDRDSDVSRDEPFVIEAMKLPRGAGPWIIISNKTTFSGPLPPTVSETLALIEKYKG